MYRKKQHASSSSIHTIPSKNIAFIQGFFFESRNVMQYHTPNAILDQTGSIVIRLESGHRLDRIGIRTFARCDFRHSIGSLSLVTSHLYQIRRISLLYHVTKAAFTLGPVLFRFQANRTRRVDFASGLHSHYKRLTRRERYAPTSPCTHCVCFATGCNPITCT